MLQFMGLQRIGHDWVSKLNYNQNNCGSILNNNNRQLFNLCAVSLWSISLLYNGYNNISHLVRLSFLIL